MIEMNMANYGVNIVCTRAKIKDENEDRTSLHYIHIEKLKDSILFTRLKLTRFSLIQQILYECEDTRHSTLNTKSLLSVFNPQLLQS